MVSGCGAKTVKFLLFIFNFLFFIVGGVVCGLAIWLRCDSFALKKYFHEVSTNSDKLPIENVYIALYIIIGLSGLMMILGALGCVGAWCESVGVLGVFFTIVLILFLAQIAIAIYVAVEWKAFKTKAPEWYQTEIIDVYTNTNDTNRRNQVRSVIDELNSAFKCCNNKGCGGSTSNPVLHNDIITSCKCEIDSAKLGCPDQMITTVEKYWWAPLVAAVVILLIELLAMIFSCVLCCSIRSSGDYDYYY